MITVYFKNETGICARPLAVGDAIPNETLWIDMLLPTHEEELAFEKQLDIEIPTREEAWKNQMLNRLYQEDDVAYMTAAVITKVDECPPRTSSITFILAPNYLL